MTGELSSELREFMREAAAGLAGAYPFSPMYEVSLTYAGTEISGNGYLRAEAAVGSPYAATFARALTVITATSSINHNMLDGVTITVTDSDDLTALPLGDYVINYVSATTFEITSPASGTIAGPVAFTFRPPAFWALTDNQMTQVPEFSFPAASGGNWVFDELRLHDTGASGGYLMKFPFTSDTTVVNGNTLTIPAGTLIVDDVSETLT